MRKFEVVSKYIKEDGTTDAKIPERKTKFSAGYDISSVDDVFIYPKHFAIIKTGIKVAMEEGEYLDVRIRSGLSTKNQIMLINGAAVIDSDYYNNPDNEGHIMVPLINLGVNAITINKGDRIAQGIFTKYLLTDDDKASGTRISGLGSTGKGEEVVSTAKPKPRKKAVHNG